MKKIIQFKGRKDGGIGHLFHTSLLLWARGGPRRAVTISRIVWRMWRANRRRERIAGRLGRPVPFVIAISPTMRCNYGCRGCYSRGRPEEDELSPFELEAFVGEAEEFGVLAVLFTGGEPLLRQDLPDLVAGHPRMLFVLVTNGSLLTPELAAHLARCGNTMTLVSIEGEPCDTETRRGPDTHETARQALEMLDDAGAISGFAATAGTYNIDHLASDAFLDGMIGLGCSVGYFTEYVPCGRQVLEDWMLDRKAREEFRSRVLDLRRRKRIILIQFPQDEYGEDNRCSAAGRASLHINSQGGVEPCPFAPVSCENIREGGLKAAIESPFLRAIRASPELLRRDRFACALFEHREEIEDLASEYRARSPGDGLKV